MSENFLGKYITIDNLSNSKAEIIPVGNTEQNVIEEVKGNTVIGTNIVVNDVESTAAKIKLIGDIQQETREGYNLLEVTLTSETINEVKFTVYDDKSINIKGTPSSATGRKFAEATLEAGTYTVYCKGMKNAWGEARIEVHGIDNSVISSLFLNNETKVITLTESGKIELHAITLTTVDYTFYPMVLKGDVTANLPEYEAYGKTPTPNNPSEVKTVTGNVEVSIDNGNLFNFQKWVDSGFSINTGTKEIINNSIKITGTSGDTFTMTYGQNLTVGASNVSEVNKYGFKIQPSTKYILTYEPTYKIARSVYAFCYDKDKKYLSMYASSGSSLKFTTPANAEYVCFRFGISVNGGTEIFSNIRLNRGEEDLGYVEHKSQAKTISLGDIELCKIGDYADYFHKVGSKWFLRKNINIVNAYDICKNTSYYEFNSTYKQHVFNNVINNLKEASLYTNTNKKLNMLSNCFIAQNFNDALVIDKNNLSFLYVNTSTNQLRFKYGDVTTKEEFLNLLNEKNVKLYYPLATPTDTEITDETLISQLNAIKEASAYPGTTIIMSTGDVLPVNVEFTYNHVVPSPSLEIPSEVKSVGDDINLCINNYTEDNKLTFTASKDDDIVITSIYAPLEAGKAYKLSFESDGKYGYTNGTDTVQAFLMRNKQYDPVINIYDLNEKIIPTVSGDYYIRVDINQKGKTYSFWNFKISEYSDTKPVYSPEGMGAIKHVVANKNLAYDVKYQNTNAQYGYTVLCSYKLSKGSYYIMSFDTENTGQFVYANQGEATYGYRRVSSNFNTTCNGTRKHWVIQALDSLEHKGLPLVNKNENNSINTGYTYNFMIEQIPATSDKEALTYLPTEYVENKKQEYIILTQKPFRAIGDYKDTFINIEGKWYENHVIGKYIIDGTENIAKVEEGYYFVVSDMFRNKIYCNQYKNYNDYSNFINKEYAIGVLYKSIDQNVYIRHKDIGSASILKDYYKELYDNGNPVEIYYVKKQSELIRCTPQQENILKQLQNIHMYSGINNFYGESFIEPQINLTVKKSVEDYDMYITADGYLHIPELNKRYLVDLYESNIPIMPEAVESSVRVAGRDGDIGLNTTYEPIPFNIVCYTEDDLSLLEKVNEEKAMNKFLNKIKNKKIKLAFEKYDSYYEVKYNLALVTSNYPKHLKFSIPLKSSDSYGKELIKKIIIGSASKESDTIENVGAIFTIYGPAISPIISLNDYSMEFSTDILEGSRIEIDSNKSTITHINSDGVKTNVMKYYNHQFPKIENGNNQLKILSGIKNGGNVIVEWNDLKL